MPFDNKPPSKKRGLKIDNQTSTVPQPKTNTATAFDEQAQKVFDKYQEYKERAGNLSVRFKAMIESKIIPINKTVMHKDLEKEVLDGLVGLASDMNADENQPEGIGAVILSTLLMKMLLVQRDTTNVLAFKVDLLEKSLKKLEELIKTTSNQ